jgi:hypothetical protein
VYDTPLAMPQQSKVAAPPSAVDRPRGEAEPLGRLLLRDPLFAGFHGPANV